jgi:uncharacterized protein
VNNHISKIAKELNLNIRQVQSTAQLLGEDATVPFIARYRKEATGSLDEVAITSIRDRLAQLAELDKRREAIIQSLSERELLTDELGQQINAAETMAELEDIYLPYRPKRRTRATIAREKGLEPLAMLIMLQKTRDIESEAARFINEEKGVVCVEDALSGARDIIAEMVSEDQEARANMRELYTRRAVVTSSVVKGRDEEGAKYKDYFEWSEPVSSAPSHRVLAMMRGEKEGFLKLHIAPTEAECINALCRYFVRGFGPASEQVALAVEDSYKRLLGPSMETEIRGDL